MILPEAVLTAVPAYDNDFRTSTSVVVPSFHEDPDVLDRCLDSSLAQDPTEVIVVLDVDDTEAYQRLLRRRNPRLHVMVIVHEGKRSALGVGIRAATSEVEISSQDPGLTRPCSFRGCHTLRYGEHMASSRRPAKAGNRGL